MGQSLTPILEGPSRIDKAEEASFYSGAAEQAMPSRGEASNAAVLSSYTNIRGTAENAPPQFNMPAYNISSLNCEQLTQSTAVQAPLFNFPSRSATNCEQLTRSTAVQAPLLCNNKDNNDSNKTPCIRTPPLLDTPLPFNSPINTLKSEQVHRNTAAQAPFHHSSTEVKQTSPILNSTLQLSEIESNSSLYNQGKAVQASPLSNPMSTYHPHSAEEALTYLHVDIPEQGQSTLTSIVSGTNELSKPVFIRKLLNSSTDLKHLDPKAEEALYTYGSAVEAHTVSHSLSNAAEAIGVRDKAEKAKSLLVSDLYRDKAVEAPSPSKDYTNAEQAVVSKACTGKCEYSLVYNAEQANCFICGTAEQAIPVINSCIDSSSTEQAKLSMNGPSIKEVSFRTQNSENLTPVISIKINSVRVDAVVDTAAQVTVINNSFYEKYFGTITSSEPVKLKGVGDNQSFESKLVRHQTLSVANQTFPINFYVAPITDNVILGADFLIRYQAKIDFGSNKFRINNREIPIQLVQDIHGNAVSINKVYIPKHTSIPPNSVKNVTCSINLPADKFVLFEPTLLANNLLIPRTLVNSDSIVLPVTNISDSYKKLKKDKVVGIVVGFDEIDPEVPAYSPTVRSVNVSGFNSDGKTVDELKDALPGHVRDLFIKSCADLSIEETRQLADLLYEYQDIFASSDLDLGTFKGVKHKIDTGTAKPIKQRMRRTPLGFESEEQKHLEQMLKMGVIRESNSEWASPPVLVRKKDGTVRWCVDYRALNNVTIKDAFPLPRISECIDALKDSSLWSTLDLQSGYWQIELDSEEDMAKTAFITKYGLYEHSRLPFGLCNSPATFSRAIQLVLRGLCWSIVLAYLDDVVIMGKSFAEHLKNLRIVFDRFRKFDLKLKARKCALFQSKIIFLGRSISAAGVEIVESDIAKVRNWERPSCYKDLQKFLATLIIIATLSKISLCMRHPFINLSMLPIVVSFNDCGQMTKRQGLLH